MATFAVVAITGHALVDQAVAAHYPGASFQVAPGHWVVSAVATSQEVATKIGFVPGQPVTGVVYSVVGYYGLANPQVWEWLRAHAITGGATGPTG